MKNTRLINQGRKEYVLKIACIFHCFRLYFNVANNKLYDKNLFVKSLNFDVLMRKAKEEFFDFKNFFQHRCKIPKKRLMGGFHWNRQEFLQSLLWSVTLSWLVTVDRQNIKHV